MDQAAANAGQTKSGSGGGSGRSDKAVTTLAALAEKLVLLRVTTVIGAAKVTLTPLDDGGDKVAVDLGPAADQLVASSTMDMLLGDFTQVFSPDFVSKPDYAALHASALSQAHDTRDKTIAMLKEIATYLAEKL